MVRPQKQRKHQSIYVKQNKAYQTLLATLIILFVLVCAVAISHTDLPTSRVWKDNILIRMIENTQQFIRQQNP